MLVATLAVAFVFAMFATTAFAQTACSTGTTTLRVGSKGDAVKCLQSAVGVTADGSFGPITKAAVQTWQTSKSLVADGIFGRLSRAAFTGGTVTVSGTTLPAGCTSTSGYSPTTGTKCDTAVAVSTTLPAGCTSTAGYSPTTGTKCDSGGTTTTTTNPTGPVSVALATDNPASRSVTTTEAGADLAHFSFTGSGTVTNITLKRTGISADASLSSVYLYDGALRLTDAASVSSGSMITFNDPNGLFVVNGSRTISIKSDMAGNSGETIGVALVSFTASGQAIVTLSAPLSGNLMTVASATLAGVSFGTITPAANANLTPDNDVIVWQSTAAITTRDVWLSRFTIREVGSIAKTDISNLRLIIDATTVATVANPDANGYSTFALTSPLKLITGSHTFKVLADVTGGSSLTFTFSIRNRTDIGLVDSQYNVGFLTSTVVGSLTAGQQTISTGYVTVQKATDSPTSTIVLAGTDVVLGRFTAKTYGEKVKVDTMLVDFSGTSGTTLRNGRILVDGQQVGSTTTINPASTGTSFNVNHTFLPGATAIIEVRADIYNNDADALPAYAAGDTIQVILSTGVNNAQGLVSGDATLDVPTANVNANSLTVGSGSITLAKDQVYGNQSVVVPTTATLLGSWVLTSGTTEALNLDTIQVDLAFLNEFAAADLSNVYVMYGSKITSSKATVSATAGANTWNISEAMAVNSTMTFKVYGDIATGAVVDTVNADTVIPSLLVSGTSASGTAVNTNSNTVLAGQTITAVNSGSLTVSLDANTPIAAQVVAGTTDSGGSLKIKLAGTNEDQYVKTVRIYANTSANSAAISSMNLAWSATSNGAYATVGQDQTLTNDGTNPGYSVWSLTGASRVTVPKNGSIYLKVTPSYVSSGQTEVSGLTPKLFLGDLQAEGTSLLAAGGTTATLINSTGIIIQANSSAVAGRTYIDSTENRLAAAITATATTITTAGGQTFLPGDIIFVDWSGPTSGTGDEQWTPADEELMVVLADAGANLTVKRGAFGTTATAIDATGTDSIFRLNTATMTTSAGLVGNAMTVLETKLGFAIKSDAPSGAFTGGTDKYLFGVTVTAANNSADTATNTATINRIDVTSNKSAASVANLKAYPSEYNQNSTYATTCVGLSETKWRCTLSSTGSTNLVDENSSRSYTFRGDLGYSAAGSVDFSIAALGTSDTSTNSVSWSDGAATPTTQVWVNQATTVIQGGSLTTTAASGTRDQTVPTMTAIGVASSGTTDDSVDAGDIITITLSEMIDPSNINASLVPGGSAVTGVAATATGGVTGVQADGIITVTNITTFDSGASIAAAASFTTDLTLNSAGTLLTITLNTGTARVVTTPALGAGTTVVGTATVGIKDVNGNVMASAASPVPTQTGGGTAF